MPSANEDRTFTRTDPITVEMEFVLDGGGLQMWGRAYPGLSSGSQFGSGRPKSAKPVREQIDEIIKQQTTWLRNFYPLRPLKLKVTRPDVRQLTLAEVA
jgi:hypothetical protein